MNLQLLMPVLLLALGLGQPVLAETKVVQKFVRFRSAGTTAYGIVEGDWVRRLEGDLFGTYEKSAEVFALADVEVLLPTVPSKVIAMAGNYRSHLKDQKIDPRFEIPQAFFKTPSCLLPHGGTIELPAGSSDVHFEGELVLVIGKRARNVPVERARDYIFGVTCGNDVSARDWQKNDVQWWRAKGSDTFGPCGPYIVAGLDYDNLQLELRQNGKAMQRQSTRDLIHNCAAIVSFISRHLTLEPGDLIYTGTPGKTSRLREGDTVEVEIEPVGVLRNRVRAVSKQGGSR